MQSWGKELELWNINSNHNDGKYRVIITTILSYCDHLEISIPPTELAFKQLRLKLNGISDKRLDKLRQALTTVGSKHAGEQCWNTLLKAIVKTALPQGEVETIKDLMAALPYNDANSYCMQLKKHAELFKLMIIDASATEPTPN
jgi:hypothetical protein